VRFARLAAEVTQPTADAGGGFRALFDALRDRKLRELRGRRWRPKTDDDPTGASDVARQAEAARRAARELARRVERQTGRRPAEATIRRAAREDRLPRGADPVVLARQARIDRAGGITALARQVGSTGARITRWRDNPAARLPTAAQAPTVRVGVEVIGTVIVNGNEYPDKRIPEHSKTALSYLDLPVDSPILDAWNLGDTATIGDLLGEQIAMQIIVPTWNLPPQYAVDFRVTELRQFQPDD